MIKSQIFAIAAVLAISNGALAQEAGTDDDMSMDHAAHHGTALPTEQGDGGYAAIAEIVAMLEADPGTDWSTVNITALREHLVDMDLLVQAAEVTQTPTENGLEMRVSLEGRGGEAAGRMVPAHSHVLMEETGWDSHVEEMGNHLIWRVEGIDDTDTQRIQALGFFGLMATGIHHQGHHWAMATGQPHH